MSIEGQVLSILGAVLNAADQARSLKEEDKRFNGIRVLIPFRTGVLKESPQFITISCSDSQTTPYVAVLSRDLAEEIGNNLLKLVRVIDGKEKLEEK